MAKKDLFQKFSNYADYTDQLEEILEKKPFSADTKNLLLSMLYRLETSYNDYETVKRMVEQKNKTIEDILDIIKDCKEIKLVDPMSARMKYFREKNIMFKVDQRNKIIETEPNEKAMLNAIYSLPIEKKVYLDEEYSAIRNALPYVLEKGKNINRAEIIRDFDAWSWNTTFSEISDIESNLIYQNLQILLGREFLQGWMKLEHKRDSLEMLRNKLNDILESEDTDEFLDLIFKLSIIICCRDNPKEEKRLREELRWNAKELNRLNNTEKLIEELSGIKAKCIKEIRKLDKILNNKPLFVNELKRVNAKIEEDFRLLTPEDLKINLKRQRKKLEKKIKEANDMLDVNNYIQIKKKIEDENKLLVSILESERKEEYIYELQKYFIKGIKSKIVLSNNKKELIDLMYLVRYYNFIPYSNEEYIKDIKELQHRINETEDTLLEKMEEQKIINKFSNSRDFDKKLVKKIFDMRLINLENINVKFIKDEKIKIIFYDVETIEKEFEITNKVINILKYNKKIKMFI